MLVRFYRWMMKEPEPCQNCEMLKSMLTSEQYEKKQLLNSILQLNEPKMEVKIQGTDELKPILPNFVPWRVRQQMLEQEDRVKAKIIKDKEKEKEEIDKLEKELKVNNG